MKKQSRADWASLIRGALKEDLGAGDITTKSLIPPTMRVTARLVAREPLVVCGLAAARMSFQSLDHTYIYCQK